MNATLRSHFVTTVFCMSVMHQKSYRLSLLVKYYVSDYYSRFSFGDKKITMGSIIFSQFSCKNAANKGCLYALQALC